MGFASLPLNSVDSTILPFPDMGLGPLVMKIIHLFDVVRKDLLHQKRKVHCAEGILTSFTNFVLYVSKDLTFFFLSKKEPKVTYKKSNKNIIASKMTEYSHQL